MFYSLSNYSDPLIPLINFTAALRSKLTLKLMFPLPSTDAPGVNVADDNIRNGT
jgi:hypothetical protein